MKPPSSQHDTQPFKSRPFIAPTAPPRPHLRHTPRPDSELLEPPAEGSAWTWNPEIVNADGANAAPNAVRNVCQEENSEHSILRGHCSVHQQRLIQQNKYQIFPGVDRAEAMQMAEQLSAWNSCLHALVDHMKLLSLGNPRPKDFNELFPGVEPFPLDREEGLRRERQLARHAACRRCAQCKAHAKEVVPDCPSTEEEGSSSEDDE